MNMKKTIIIALLALVATIAQAQRFEWAKGFEVENNDRPLIGGITDSLGNLYVLSDMDAVSSWDGEALIPPPNKEISKSLKPQVLIAKISPEGEMVWKKIIVTNPDGNHKSQDIKKVGDSALACLIQFMPPKNTGYMYYLDTFIVGANNYSCYPIDGRYMGTGFFTLYLLLDFNGNVKEQHFLNISYTDTNGNDIVTYENPQIDSTPWLLGTWYQQASFDIDDEGNIYISRRTMDQYTDYYTHTLHDLEDGSIGGYKFWVDKRLAGEYTIEGEPQVCYTQLVKFSPHFDTLLLCKSVFEKTDEAWGESYSKIKCIDNNRILYMGRLCDTQNNNVITVDSSQGMYITYTEFSDKVGFIIMYNDSLIPSYLVYIKDSVTGPNLPIGSHINLYDMDYDIDSNRLFISWGPGKDFNSNTLYVLGNTVLNAESACVISLDLTTGDFQRLMVVPSVKGSDLVSSFYSKGNLLCRNNRVLIQNRYSGGMRFPNQNIQIPVGKLGLCLTMFDYSGRVIGGIDYSCLSPDNRPGSIIMHDSILYLHNMLTTSARFGDVDFPVVGATHCIAKYVDTALMHPYVWNPAGIMAAQAVQPKVYPVPATDMLHFVVPQGTATKAVAISVLGNKTALPTKCNSADVSALAPGTYILEISNGKTKYYSKFIKQ